MTAEPVVHIVDDDAEIRAALSLLLSTAGWPSRVYQSAEAFLDATPVEPFCLLLDVRLPGLNGLKVLEELRKRGSAACTIVITGHGDVPMAVAAMKGGAFHFVEKPFEPEILLEIVKEALEHVNERKEEQAKVAEIQARYRTLTPREQDVMQLLIEGLPSKLIGARLDISTRTAEHHRAAVMRKMQARTLSHLVRMSFALAAVTGTPPR
jgi:two-component system response regulator FixJ